MLAKLSDSEVTDVARKVSDIRLPVESLVSKHFVLNLRWFEYLGQPWESWLDNFVTFIEECLASSTIIDTIVMIA